MSNPQYAESETMSIESPYQWRGYGADQITPADVTGLAQFVGRMNSKVEADLAKLRTEVSNAVAKITERGDTDLRMHCLELALKDPSRPHDLSAIESAKALYAWAQGLDADVQA